MAALDQLWGEPEPRRLQVGALQHHTRLLAGEQPGCLRTHKISRQGLIFPSLELLPFVTHGISVGPSRRGFDGLVQPGKEQLVSNRQHDGADEETNDAHCQEPPHRTEENHEDGDREAPSEQQRLQHVVHEGNDDAPNQEGHRLGRTRCGMHFQLLRPGNVRAAFARDFYSGSEIPAEKAFYVEGGNEEYCAHVQPVERKEIQSTAELAYDRCTPPLVAFAKVTDAEKYRAEHGGRLLTYSEAVDSVRQR
jgi:hypothetical protein